VLLHRKLRERPSGGVFDSTLAVDEMTADENGRCPMHSTGGSGRARGPSLVFCATNRPSRLGQVQWPIGERDRPRRFFLPVLALLVPCLASAFALGGSPRPSAPRPVYRAPAAEPALAPGLLSTPGGAYEWQFAATGANRVPGWVRRSAASITIGVVDTGVDRTAPDLAEKTSSSYDAAGGRGAVDRIGHGTFVASLAAGSGRNTEGLEGFGGDARLIVVNAASRQGTVTDVAVAEGIVYAVLHGARIVNLSLSGVRPSSVERAALAFALRRGALVVTAAGNDYLAGNPLQYPAVTLDQLTRRSARGGGLVVAASDTAGRRAAFSSTGASVALAAPGVNVFGAVSSLSSPSRFPRVRLPGSRSGLYGFASGTSYAAAEVSGAAALVWAARPSLSAREVARLLEGTASGHAMRNDELGYGVIDVAAAVSAALR
jgi:subtilisin family serine protease